MATGKRIDRKNICYWQFQGGYAQVHWTMLRALMEGYRRKLFRRNEVRVFAGRLECAALHRESKVDLYRVVNADSKRKGNRRLSQSQIAAAEASLETHLPALIEPFIGDEESAGGKPELKPVARRVLRHVARGGATTVEALFLFAYFMRRIRQRQPYQRLLPGEHFARFRYVDFEQWTGVHRATQSRLLVRLMQRGLINTVAVAKQNENAYGQLFIDGSMLSLVRPRQHARRQLSTKSGMAAEKRSTPVKENVTSPGHKRSTLINGNLKTEIGKRDELVSSLMNGCFARHKKAEMRRIADRARQMVEMAIDQAA